MWVHASESERCTQPFFICSGLVMSQRGFVCGIITGVFELCQESLWADLFWLFFIAYHIFSDVANQYFTILKPKCSVQYANKNFVCLFVKHIPDSHFLFLQVLHI